MDFNTFITLALAHPWSLVALILNFAVIFINGWTDGPNAIATAVTTRALSPKKGVALSAVMNLLGVLSIGFLADYMSDFGDVSQTIANLVHFVINTDADLDRAFIAISSGLVAIIAWSLGSTYFGFPSSESNELVGGMTGAAMALAALSGENWFSLLGAGPWIKVLIGFFGSLVLGFVLGYLLTKLIEVICKRFRRGQTSRFFDKGQAVSAGLMSYVHGLQDGAKFIGVFILLASLLTSFETTTVDTTSLKGVWWIYVPVAVLMTLGTCMGGFSIIKTLGHDMAKLQKYQAFATDIASTIGLLLATFLGLPVSTGTVKSTAILGGGASKSLKRVHWDVAGKMVGSWILIFPLTAVIGFLFTIIFAAFIH